MIKFILSGVIIAFCVFLGYFAAWKYRARKKYFSQFQTFNERYLNELAYARRPLPVFLKEYAYSDDFDKTINCLLGGKKEVKLNYLSKDERNYLNDYFEMLGKGDSASQNAFFRRKRNIWKRKKEEAKRKPKAAANCI